MYESKENFISTWLSRIISISRSIDSSNNLFILFSILKCSGLIGNSKRTLKKTCYDLLAIFYQIIRIHIRMLIVRMMAYTNCCNLVTSCFLVGDISKPRVRINGNILNCEKKWPEGLLKAHHRRKTFLISGNLQWKQSNKYHSFTSQTWSQQYKGKSSVYFRV